MRHIGESVSIILRILLRIIILLSNIIAIQCIGDDFRKLVHTK